MKLNKLSVRTISVHNYVDIFSVFSGSDMSHELAVACNDIVMIYDDAATRAKFPILLWASMDRTSDEADPPAYQKFTLSCLDVRIDAFRSANELERYSIGLSATILNPRVADMLRQGRATFRQWLVAEFLKQLRIASLEVSQEHTSSLLLNTRVWIHGQTSQLFGYDATGEPRVFNETLPEQEEAYINPSFLFGPPLDGPPYTRNQGATS